MIEFIILVASMLAASRLPRELRRKLMEDEGEALT